MFGLVLAGCGGNEDSSLRLEPYRAFLDEGASQLVRDVQAMQPELESGEVARAQSRWVRARVRYCQIEPASESDRGLDRRINALPQHLSGAASEGFHAIEDALWHRESAKGTPAIGRRLITASKELERKLAVKRYEPALLSTAAERILDEISLRKLANREDVYSGADLVCVSANLEWVGQALTALRPVLEREEWDSLHRLLRRAYGAIGEYGTPARDPDQPRDRSPGAIFVVFDELSAGEVEGLRRPVDDLGQAFRDTTARLED